MWELGEIGGVRMSWRADERDSWGWGIYSSFFPTRFSASAIAAASVAGPEGAVERGW